MDVLEEIKKEYESQDNRATAYPIYVMVQERVCVGVLRDGYSVYCPYGDGEEVTEYRYEGYDGSFKSVDEIKQTIANNGDDPFDDDLVEEFVTGWIWHPVEFFLTIKGAEEYMKLNAHNHGKLRTYVSHFDRRNIEMRTVLKEVGFRTQE
jgi:hypothetical protein